MKLLWLFLLTLLLTTSSLATPSPQLQYQTYDLPEAIIHTLLIPTRSKWIITVDQNPQLATVGEFATQSGAIAVLNGGFFDPHNQLSTSYVIQNGQIISQPQDNPRLVNNPDLQSYLPLIFNRSEFRRYQCGSQTRYSIARRDQPIPVGCNLVDALGAGPQLLPELTAVSEGFADYQDNILIRDALGMEQPNSRTAIAITHSGDVLWIMVAQKNSSSGLSLEQLANFCRDLGVKSALNLDGGSSTSFYWSGNTYYGKITPENNQVVRSVKSVLLLSQ